MVSLLALVDSNRGAILESPTGCKVHIVYKIAGGRDLCRCRQWDRNWLEFPSCVPSKKLFVAQICGFLVCPRKSNMGLCYHKVFSSARLGHKLYISSQIWDSLALLNPARFTEKNPSDAFVEYHHQENKLMMRCSRENREALGIRACRIICMYLPTVTWRRIRKSDP